ncbi:virulence factor TspB C-terminal domain-related protein [Aquitalea sp. ASV11]|uniref:virulence factor TspB C-terminal domain-related protein n=1 Tax=Aquitalea sp. ASV11 TaxID=2795103 RepID=UPI0018EB6ACE|nr:virulence factor TspB C-terminal domain-related protein [Aquitalea sp. ASV11]
MWRVIGLLLVCLGLAGFCSADTIPATVSNSSIVQIVYQGNSGCTGQPLSCFDGDIASLSSATGKPVKMTFDGSMFYISHYFVDGTSQVDEYGRFFPQYSCPSGYTLSGTNCTKPDIIACTQAQVDSMCASSKGTGLMLSSTSTSVCGPPINNPSGCSLPAGSACKMTARYNPLGPTIWWDFTGQSCATNSADPVTPDKPQPLPQSPADCKPGEYWGKVGGPNGELTGCFGGGPIPPSTSNPSDKTGKDANGNCAAGYVGSIDENGNLVCRPTVQPDSNVNCPAGYNKIAVGGTTICVSTTPGTGGQTAGPAGSQSPNGGWPKPKVDASGGSGTGSGSGTGNGNGDGTCTGSKCGDGDGCPYSGMFAFMCDSTQTFSPDTSGLAGESGGDLSSMLNTTNDFVFGNSSCPPDLTVDYNVAGYTGTLSLTYQPWCTVAGWCRPVVIAVALVLAAMIALGRTK